jgi:hypothetical protein
VQAATAAGSVLLGQHMLWLLSAWAGCLQCAACGDMGTPRKRMPSSATAYTPKPCFFWGARTLDGCRVWGFECDRTWIGALQNKRYGGMLTPGGSRLLSHAATVQLCGRTFSPSFSPSWPPGTVPAVTHTGRLFTLKLELVAGHVQVCMAHRTWGASTTNTNLL